METSHSGTNIAANCLPRNSTYWFQYALRKNRRRIALESWANSTKKTGIKQKKIAFKADSVKSIYSVTTKSSPVVSTKSQFLPRRREEQR